MTTMKMRARRQTLSFLTDTNGMAPKSPNKDFTFTISCLVLLFTLDKTMRGDFTTQQEAIFNETIKKVCCSACPRIRTVLIIRREIQERKILRLQEEFVITARLPQGPGFLISFDSSARITKNLVPNGAFSIANEERKLIRVHCIDDYLKIAERKNKTPNQLHSHPILTSHEYGWEPLDTTVSERSMYLPTKSIF